MRSLRLFFTLITLTLATFAHAEDLFSTKEPESLFTIGLRLGLNTSTRTFPSQAFNKWNVNSWGVGADIGCVADLNIRDFISIQPGLFIETRSGNYSFAQVYYDYQGKQDDFSQLGHDRSYNITVPILASLKLNLSDELRAVFEIGPYAQYYFHDSAKGKIRVIMPQPTPESPVDIRKAWVTKYDAGLKVGGGITFKRRYSCFVHYLAGTRRAWRSPYMGGLNKSWLFTLGYDL